MGTLTVKKRKWIIQQYRCGRSASVIARIQKVSRRYVYTLVCKHKKIGVRAYEAKKAGRHRRVINPKFVNRVIELRQETDYGSEKLHYILKRAGFSVAQRQIQRILDENGLTDQCENLRGRRKYVKFVWPVPNYMWHCDWSEYERKQYIAFIDDCSRKIMACGCFESATEQKALFVLYQAILTNQATPVVILSDKGSQFYANTKTKTGQRAISKFEEELKSIGIELWTSRRNHPQTNGKMEKWFDTLKKRKRKHPSETLQDFVNWYNEKRIHHALAYKTPNEIYNEKV